jgi:hypothetical protein
MIFNKYPALLYLSLLALMSCSSKLESEMSGKCSYLPESMMPEWVTQPIPEDEIFIYGYGVSEQIEGGISELRRKSIDDARADLGQSIIVKIKTQLTSSTLVQNTIESSEVKRKVDRYINSESDIFLAQSQIIDTWFNPVGCQFWTRVRLDKESQQNTSDKIAAQAYQYQNSLLEAISLQIDDLKKETSSDPRKELANRGLMLAGEDLGQTILRADTENLELYFKAGMNFYDAVATNSMVPLPDLLMTLSVEKLRKLFTVFSEYPNNGPYLGGMFLHHAALLGNIDKVELLLEHGANPHSKYNGYIDLGVLDPFAMKFVDSSASCAVSYGMHKAQEQGIDVNRWQEVKSKFDSLQVKSEGEIQFRSSLDTERYRCDRELVAREKAMSNKKAQQCKHYYSKMTQQQLDKLLIALAPRVHPISTPNTVEELALKRMLPHILMGGYREDELLSEHFRKELLNGCEAFKSQLCVSNENNDYELCI